MIRIFKLVLLLVVSQVAFGQAPTNYTNINGRYRWIAGMFDSTFHIPKGTAASLRTGGSTNAGALFYNTTDSSVYTYTSTQWIKLRGVIIDTTSLSNRINLKLNISDTASMLSPYLRKVDTASLSNRINLKVNISDTASMLLPYLRKIDTASLSNRINLKLNISDTASMLSPYARTVNVRAIIADSLGGLQRLKALSAAGAGIYSNSGTKVAEWGLGGGANFDFHGFAGYDINRAGNYTVRSFTDKNYVDSAITASPSGTVTSVATNNGTGITGGTITTAGTLAIDTALISTRLWRQKGIDSVQSNLTAGLALKVNISDTSSMLSPYLRKIDTTAMLSPYARKNFINAGTGISYSSSTGTIANTAPDQTVAISSGTGISVTGTYPNFTITNTSPSSGGTVTSVATNNGTGITGGTITGAGTLAIDTVVISTRAWRQKGIDSVATLANTKVSSVSGLAPISSSGGTTPTISIPKATASVDGYLAYTDWNFFADKIGGSGTTNYIPKFTSSSAIGNSQVFDNGTNVGIGTATPAYKLDVSGRVNISNAASAWNSFTTNQLRIAGTASGQSMSISFTDNNNSNGWFGYKDDATAANRYFYWSANDGSSQQMILNSSGNLGLGFTPSAWEVTDSRVLQLNGGSLWSFSTSQINLLQNSYFNSSGNLIYTNNGVASAYRQISGVHSWYTAPSGTAGNAISFTQAMTLDASGRLLVGTISNVFGERLTVNNWITAGDLTRVALMGQDGTDVVMGAYSNHNLVLRTNNTARLTIASTGAATFSSSVSVSTTNPSGRALSVGGEFSIGSNSSNTYELIAFINSSYARIGPTYQTGGSYVPLTFWTSDTERMRITSGGNVGIGTTNPTSLLHLFSSTAGVSQRIESTATNGEPSVNFYGKNSSGTVRSFAIKYDNTDIIRFGTSDAIPIRFETTDIERMRITSGGEVGIGTSTMSSGIPLSISAGSGLNTNIAFQQAGTNKWFIRNLDGTDDFSFYSVVNSAERMRITSVGNVGIGTQTPNKSGSSTAFTVNTTTAANYSALELSSGDALSFYINANDANSYIVSYGSRPMIFNTNGSERMRITSGGELLINTTSDAGDYKLQVNGQIYSTNSANNYLSIFSTGTFDAGLSFGSSTTNKWYIYKGNDDRFEIYSAGRTGSAGAVMTIDYTGANVVFEKASIKTAAPTSGTAKPWKFGAVVSSSVYFIDSQYVEVEIDGTLYRLALAGPAEPKPKPEN